jgi:hypothetical protein
MPFVSINSIVGAGSGSASSLVSSSAMRSRDRAIRSRARGARRERFGIGGAIAETGVEAEEAQDAQVILGNPRQRIADEADMARRQIGAPVEIVEDLARQRIGIKRVDREIPPRSILAPIVRKGDSGAPAIGRDIAAQGGDFDGAIGQDRGDGAVRDPRRDHLDTGIAQPLHRILGGSGVAISMSCTSRPSKRVADRAAHEARHAVRRPAASSPSSPSRSRHAASGRSVRPCQPLARLTIIAAVAPQMRRSPHR